MSAAFLLGVPGKLKTLLDRLTVTRAGYLDAAISTRASSTEVNLCATTSALSTTKSDLTSAINLCSTASALATAKSDLTSAINLRASATDLATAKSDLTTAINLRATSAALTNVATAVNACATGTALDTAKSELTAAINLGNSTSIWSNSSRTLSSGVNRCVLFTSTGSWVVPEGVTSILVTLVGGGGGGYSNTNAGRGGSSGATILRIPQMVVSGQTLGFVVGAAGIGRNYSSGVVATAGGSTSFRDFVVTGGSPGVGTSAGGTANVLNGISGFTAPAAIDGAKSVFGPGGTGQGMSASSTAYGAGGAGHNTLAAISGNGASGCVLIEY